MGQKVWACACALSVVVGALNGACAAEAEAQAFTAAEAQNELEAKLDSPLPSPLEYVATPLNQIMKQLAVEYGIEIAFDEVALDSAAMSPDIETTINVRGVTLRTALDLMMRGMSDLTYATDSGVLLITTQAAADAWKDTRAYRVEDLATLVRDGESGEQRADLQPLVRMLENCVEPESWASNGTGEGSIAALEPGILVVYQSKREHAEIEKVLRSIRAVRAAIASENPQALERKLVDPVRQKPGAEPGSTGLGMADRD